MKSALIPDIFSNSHLFFSFSIFRFETSSSLKHTRKQITLRLKSNGRFFCKSARKRERDWERKRGRKREREKERKRERARKREIEREREGERERGREKERKGEREKERKRERERERERERKAFLQCQCTFFQHTYPFSLSRTHTRTLQNEGADPPVADVMRCFRHHHRRRRQEPLRNARRLQKTV